MPSMGSLAATATRGKQIGCTTLQIFTSSPKTWRAKPLEESEIAAFRQAVLDAGFPLVVSHDTYLVNLSSPDEELRTRSLQTLLEEMRRCAALGISRVVSHIGASMGQERAVAQQRAASAILEIIDETPPEVELCMEITAGQGSALNSSLEELQQLVELCGGTPRVRVCIDTCHAFAAGYKIHSPKGMIDFWAEFESRLGWERLAVLHLNDSKAPLGSRKDRHEHLGEGELGWEPFGWLVQNRRFLGIPMILETPEAREKHEHNLRTLLSWKSRPLPSAWSAA